MDSKKIIIDDEQLEQVVGGLFVFHSKSKYVTYTHQDGSVTDHNIINYDKAWSTVCSMEAQNVKEDTIFQTLINDGLIEAKGR